MPKEPVADDIRMCNARGAEVHPGALYEPGQTNLRFAFGREVNRKRHFGWEGAYINHYAIRTNDLFLLKNVRGDGAGSRFSKRYFLNSRWHRAANRNEVEDATILRHLDGLKRMVALLREDSALVGMEAEAFARVQAMKRAHLTPDNIESWTNRGRSAIATR